MTHYVHSAGTGTSTGQDPADARRSRNTVAGVVLLMAAVVAAAFTWWLDTGQSVAGDVADSPGVDRKVDGLNILDAYLVPGAVAGGFTVVGALVISSGGADRLVDVPVGERSAVGLSPAMPRTETAAGLPVGSDHLVKIGPEPGASHITVTGPARPAAAGSFVTATFSFARRGGPISLHLPVWASVSGPAGPDYSAN
jgi:hypothetical protein